jgi:hypothetical protein
VKRPSIPYELLHLFAAQRAARREASLLAPETTTMNTSDPRDPIDDPKKPSDFVNDPAPADPVDQVELEDEDEDEDDSTGFEDDEEAED